MARIPAGRGGLNFNQNLGQVPVTDLRQAESITVEDGTWRKTGGTSKLDAAGIAGAPKVVAVDDFFPSDGIQRLLTAALDGKLYKEVGSDLDSVTLASGLSLAARPGTWVFGGAELVGNNRKAFYFNGADAVRVLSGDGATAAVIANPPTDWAAGNQPIHGVVHRFALWGFGNLNDPHRAYKSLDTNHENFTGTPFTLSIFPGVGERLVCGVSFKTLLFWFKRPRGIFWLNDQDTNSVNWFPNKLTDAVGAASPAVVLAISTLLGDEILFLSSEGTFHLLSAIDPTSGSIANSDLGDALEINTFIRRNANLDRLDQAVGRWYGHKKKAVFAMPRAGSAENDLILEFDFSQLKLNGKPTFSYSFRDTAVSLGLRREGKTDRLVFGDASGNVYLLDRAARSKDGAGYTGKYQIPQTDFAWVDPSLANKKKNLDFLELVVSPVGAYNLQADILLDGKFSETLLFDMGGGQAAIGSFVLGTDQLGGESLTNRRRAMRGDAVRWSATFSNSGAGQEFSVTEHLVGFRPGREGP